MSKDKKPHPRSIDGFCDRHGIAKQTCYNEINSGKLKTIKVGRRRIIPEVAEQQWLADKGVSNA